MALTLSGSGITSANIATDAVGASELNVSGNGTSGQVLVSDGDGTMSWGSAGGGILQMKKAHWTNSDTVVQSSNYTNLPLSITLTPTAATSSFYIHAWLNMQPINHDSQAVLNVHDSALGSSYETMGQYCFPYVPSQSIGNSKNKGYMTQWSSGADGYTDDYRSEMVYVGGLYTPALDSSSSRTFTVIIRTHLTVAINGYYFNYGKQDHPHQVVGTSHIIVQEIAGGVIT